MTEPNIIPTSLLEQTEQILAALNQLGAAYAAEGLSLLIDRDYDLEFPGKPEFRATVHLRQVVRLPYQSGDD